MIRPLERFRAGLSSQLAIKLAWVAVDAGGGGDGAAVADSLPGAAVILLVAAVIPPAAVEVEVPWCRVACARRFLLPTRICPRR